MTTTHPTAETARSATHVKGVLCDIGYVLWLSRRVAAEIAAERSQPVRPDMSEFCAVDAVDMAACAA